MAFSKKNIVRAAVTLAVSALAVHAKKAQQYEVEYTGTQPTNEGFVCDADGNGNQDVQYTDGSYESYYSPPDYITDNTDIKFTKKSTDDCGSCCPCLCGWGNYDMPSEKDQLFEICARINYLQGELSSRRDWVLSKLDVTPEFYNQSEAELAAFAHSCNEAAKCKVDKAELWKHQFNYLQFQDKVFSEQIFNAPIRWENEEERHYSVKTGGELGCDECEDDWDNEDDACDDGHDYSNPLRRLNVMVYNIWIFPEYVSCLNCAPCFNQGMYGSVRSNFRKLFYDDDYKKPEATLSIFDAIPKNTDVVVFAESWGKHEEYDCEMRERGFPYKTHQQYDTYCCGTTKLTGNGVIVYSRFEIVDFDFTVYEDMIYMDAQSSKGVIYTRLKIPEDDMEMGTQYLKEPVYRDDELTCPVEWDFYSNFRSGGATRVANALKRRAREHDQCPCDEVKYAYVNLFSTHTQAWDGGDQHPEDKSRLKAFEQINKMMEKVEWKYYGQPENRAKFGKELYIIAGDMNQILFDNLKPTWYPWAQAAFNAMQTADNFTPWEIEEQKCRVKELIRRGVIDPTTDLPQGKERHDGTDYKQTKKDDDACRCCYNDCKCEDDEEGESWSDRKWAHEYGEDGEYYGYKWPSTDFVQRPKSMSVTPFGPTYAESDHWVGRFTYDPAKNDDDLDGYSYKDYHFNPQKDNTITNEVAPGVLVEQPVKYDSETLDLILVRAQRTVLKKKDVTYNHANMIDLERQAKVFRTNERENLDQLHRDFSCLTPEVQCPPYHDHVVVHHLVPENRVLQSRRSITHCDDEICKLRHDPNYYGLSYLGELYTDGSDHYPVTSTMHWRPNFVHENMPMVTNIPDNDGDEQTGECYDVVCGATYCCCNEACCGADSDCCCAFHNSDNPVCQKYYDEDGCVSKACCVVGIVALGFSCVGCIYGCVWGCLYGCPCCFRDENESLEDGSPKTLPPKKAQKEKPKAETPKDETVNTATIALPLAGVALLALAASAYAYKKKLSAGSGVVDVIGEEGLEVDQEAAVGDAGEILPSSPGNNLTAN